MAITSFGFDEIINELQKAQSNAVFDKRIFRELQRIAEEACNKARDNYPTRDSGGYDDHTRNLRGSIGYKIFFSGEEVARGGLNGLGSEKGEPTAKAKLSEFGASYALWEVVVIAGMEYARYVEAKGYKVISFVQSYLDKEFEKLKQSIKSGNL